MKMKKLIKNYILAFVLSIISLFIISNDNINATNFTFSDGSASSFTYNEGVSYPNYSGNSNSYLSITRNSASEYITLIVESRTYTYVFNKCEISSTSASEIIFNCVLQNGINKNNTSWETLDGFNFAINKTTNLFVIYNQYQNWSYQVPTSSGGYTEEDLQNSYDEGYRTGENAGLQQGYQNGYNAGYNLGNQDGYNLGFSEGNNNLLRVTGCEILSIEDQSPSAFGYTSDCNKNSNGNTYNAYDNLNNIVNMDNLTRELMLYSDISIKFDVEKNSYFTGVLMLYTKEQTGVRISLYNNDVLVESHLVQALNGITYSFYSITMDIDFNSIVIEYEDYFVAPHEFGLIQSNTYSSISEYNYIRGYNVGYTAGNESGNNIAGIIGAIFVGPINMLSTIFDFEFLGINLAGFILSLTTLLVVIWLIKRFI